MHTQKILLVLWLMSIISSCNSSDPTPADSGENYIPLQTQYYQIYDVEEIIYQLGVPETLVYELKTVVTDSFINGAGGYTYIINRSKRNANETTWQNFNTWSVRKDDKEVVVSEENIPYLIFQFPITEGHQWNGNTYNNLINPSTNTPEDVYTIQNKGEPFSVKDQTFEDCVVVNQEDNQEFVVYFDQRKEVYARNVGLIYKEKIQLNYCTDENCVGQQIVDEGIIYKQHIKEYGEE